MSIEPMEVAAYYFPQYHRDARNDAWHGPNWTEWELVRRARPRYPGHGQPIAPAWGYFDQSDPVWAAREIDLAADHGITAFIYDWYWYEDGPFLQAALERGFLRAHSRHRLKFALMWANHDWLDFFPAGPNPRMLAAGGISPAAFDRMTNYVVDHFFGRPNYLTLDGEPYFSIYDTGTFMDGLGGLEAAGRALARFRERTRDAGFAGLHLNVMDTSFATPPGQQRRVELIRLYEALGVSSLGDYAWSVTGGEGSGDGPPHVDYAALAEEMYAAWECGLSAPVPCHPNVGMGWDPSPRMSPDVPYAPRGYPWTAVVVGNTPIAFRRAVRAARDYLSRPDVCQKVLTVNAWNEWTEGSYLLPDRVHGDAYLKGLAAALLPDHSSAA